MMETEVLRVGMRVTAMRVGSRVDLRVG